MCARSRAITGAMALAASAPPFSEKGCVSLATQNERSRSVRSVSV
jgi:hypothetical protein